MIYDIQKAPVLKRMSAFLLDFILICILAVGFMFLLSWITGLDDYSTELQATYDAVEEQYNVDFSTITQDQYNAMTPEEQANYEEAYNALLDLLEQNNAYAMTYSLLIVCLSIGLLLSFVIWEFILPLVFKNGQTVGMKVFGLGVVFTTSVRVSAFAVFVRGILGKYTLETMVPVLVVVMMLFNTIGITGVIVLAGLLIFQIGLFFGTKNRQLIHDAISSTVVVDMATQMIFNNYDEVVSLKAELSKEAAQKSKY